MRMVGDTSHRYSEYFAPDQSLFVPATGGMENQVSTSALQAAVMPTPTPLPLSHAHAHIVFTMCVRACSEFTQLC